MIFREVHEVYHKKTRTAKAVRVNGALIFSFLSLKDEPDTGRTQGTCRESCTGQQSPGKITQCEAVGSGIYHIPSVHIEINAVVFSVDPELGFLKIRCGKVEVEGQ